MALERRLLALDNKLALLLRETAAWREESAGATSRFALHSSQIGAVCDDLEAMHKMISKEVEDTRDALDPLGIQVQERRILTALQIWDSYRAKWALRVEPKLAETLNAIDDLAWLAYEPALALAVKSGSLNAEHARLPPLVFPTPRWSPFARPREEGYDIDESNGSWNRFDDFDAVLRHMPVPLIGIPWTQTAHLPEAVFVGHETGHLVEHDLGLEEPLRQAVLAGLESMHPPAPAARCEAWSVHWRSETFADLWGLLCCGPAYAYLMVDLLIGLGINFDAVQPDARERFGDYPPRALRIRLLAEGLRRLGGSDGKQSFAADAVALDALADALPVPHPMPEYEYDLPAVVEALLGTPLHNFAASKCQPAQAARSVINFSPALHQQASADAGRALNRQLLLAKDLRVLFAGLALAFRRDALGFRREEVQLRFEERLKTFRTQGKRSGSPLLKVVDPEARSSNVAKAVFGWVDQRG
jgi:hypothetical protein